MDTRSPEYLEKALRKKICPICGNDFYCRVYMYGWKIGSKVFCSYKCLRAEEKKKEQSKKQKSSKTEQKSDVNGNLYRQTDPKQKDHRMLDEICAGLVNNHAKPEIIQKVRENYVALTSARKV